MTAMNYMGYDVMTVGNHEFNWGVETLKKIMSQAAFPVLSANILNPDGTCLTGHGWTIVPRAFTLRNVKTHGREIRNDE